MKDGSAYAAIVTYNPDPERIRRNLAIFRAAGMGVAIIDNGSEDSGALDGAVRGFPGCALVRNGANLGIGAALNIGVRTAEAAGARYLLAFDQDSLPTRNYLDAMLERLAGMSGRSGAFIAAPRIRDLNQANAVAAPGGRGITAITSGSAFDVDICLKLGGFREELFIDYVDHEYCLRGLSRGYRIEWVESAVLDHEIGACTKALRISGRAFYATNHAPLRRYYQWRNLQYVLLRYFAKYPRWALREAALMLMGLAAMLVYEPDRGVKLAWVIRGILDGLSGRYGPVSAPGRGRR